MFKVLVSLGAESASAHPDFKKTDFDLVAQKMKRFYWIQIDLTSIIKKVEFTSVTIYVIQTDFEQN